MVQIYSFLACELACLRVCVLWLTAPWCSEQHGSVPASFSGRPVAEASPPSFRVPSAILGVMCFDIGICSAICLSVSSSVCMHLCSGGVLSRLARMARRAAAALMRKTHCNRISAISLLAISVADGSPVLRHVQQAVQQRGSAGAVNS